MLIRSQNKEVLVNFDVSAGIEIAEGTTKTVITSYITGCSYLLGEYSTKAKAMKVLDMIQEAYVKSEVEKYITPASIKRLGESPLTSTFEGIFKTRMVFQMPDDSEVEV